MEGALYYRVPNSASDKAGLMQGDVILRFWQAAWTVRFHIHGCHLVAAYQGRRWRGEIEFEIWRNQMRSAVKVIFGEHFFAGGFQDGGSSEASAIFIRLSDGGAGAEVILRRNSSDLLDIALRQKVLTGVCSPHLETTLFGETRHFSSSWVPWDSRVCMRAEVRS